MFWPYFFDADTSTAGESNQPNTNLLKSGIRQCLLELMRGTDKESLEKFIHGSFGFDPQYPDRPEPEGIGEVRDKLTDIFFDKAADYYAGLEGVVSRSIPLYLKFHIVSRIVIEYLTGADPSNQPIDPSSQGGRSKKDPTFENFLEREVANLVGKIQDDDPVVTAKYVYDTPKRAGEAHLTRIRNHIEERFESEYDRPPKLGQKRIKDLIKQHLPDRMLRN